MSAARQADQQADWQSTWQKAGWQPTSTNACSLHTLQASAPALLPAFHLLSPSSLSVAAKRASAASRLATWAPTSRGRLVQHSYVRLTWPQLQQREEG